MAPSPALGRGLGGSTVADQIYYFDKLVRPYRPRAIFIYAAENDIVNGLTPPEVLADFKAFMDVKRSALATTPVYYISAKASPARLKFARAEQAANELIQTLARKQADLHYVDIAHAMWEGGKLFGTLRPIYREDGIHVTDEGYAILTRMIKPLVAKETARTGACANI